MAMERLLGDVHGGGPDADEVAKIYCLSPALCAPDLNP
jgi:hypothetical protein